MNILGINAYHGDSSACIFVNNKLVVAAEEERFKRIKHFAGFPIEAINFCLEYSNLKINDIDQISINRNPSARLIPKIFFSFKKLLNPKFIKQRIDNINKISNIKSELEKYFKVKINSKINFIDHHEAHVASAIFCSGFEKCNFVSIDGFGDFASTSVGHFDGKKINKSFEILFPHSLGLFYTAITQFLGFDNYGDEYKVMGLAPYGKPNYTEQIKKILIKRNDKYELNLDYFVHHTSGINMTWHESEPKFDKVYSRKLIDLLGEDRKKDQPLNQKYKDVANSAQKVFEEIVIEIANDIYKKNISKNLCISGGCGMNSVANGKIKKNTKYEKIYIPPSPGDSGGAIGAAALTIFNQTKKSFSFSDNPYLGPKFSNNDINNSLKKFSKKFNENNIAVKQYNNKRLLLEDIAKAISEKEIIGIFNGRMEWGPRALGNRSIIADARHKDIKDIINLKIKRRESFRPFAPSILKEFTKEWFEMDEDVPFMSQVFQIKEEKRQLIPGVSHVDGSGRLQTVSKELNENYYNLIMNFYEISKVPLILNTSFNENEPIVCHPDEAINCFLRTNMDCLILEDFLLKR